MRHNDAATKEILFVISAQMENSPIFKNLKLLFTLRNIAIAGQISAIFIVTIFLQIPLKTTPLLLIIFTMMLINIITLWRIKSAKIIKEQEFFLNLLADISALFGLLYFTGGATNPFASLFILQVIIAAIILSPLYSWVISCIAVLCYTSLMFWNVEVPYFLHHHMGDFFNLHVQGMWISFMLLTGIIAWFIVRMNGTIKRQDMLLAQAEKITAMGTLATNAAHELGTPLATLTLLAENYGSEKNAKEKQHSRQMFTEQLKRCKSIISSITAAGGVARVEGGSAMELDNFVHNILRKWQEAKPGFPLNIHTPKPLPGTKILAETSLVQAIHNLLDNAADSSASGIAIEISCSTSTLKITITDHGPGLSKTDLKNIGTPGYTTKKHGMGMGVFLTKTIITRFEGTLEFRNSKLGGAIATINLPLARLAI